MGHQEDIIKTESKIIIIRDTQVILDRDVAELYGVETREINQALRNNPKKFPPGYVIELNNREKDELIKNFDRFNKLKHSTVAPHAFTEQGLYMLATILKGDLAISTTIAIIDYRCKGTTFFRHYQIFATLESPFSAAYNPEFS